MPKEDLAELAHAEYWDERYKKPEEQDKYDWLRDFKAVEPFLKGHLPAQNRHQPRILHVGCGNSVCQLPGLKRRRAWLLLAARGFDVLDRAWC